MATDYEIYERKVAKINKENDVYLDKFTKWLEKQNLVSKTIKKHVHNVDFYINTYLCCYEPQTIDVGCYSIDRFLGDWFIRKALWSSVANIKSNASSIKKFYLFILEEGKITKEDYKYLCSEIKELMPEWLEEMEAHDNMVYEDW